MDYERPVNGTYRVRKISSYRWVEEVVDNSGEIILQRWHDDIGAAFAAGETIVHGEFVVTKRETEFGPSCYKMETAGLSLSAWQEKPPRKRGGKKNYWKLKQKVQELDDESALALLRISGNIRKDGTIVDSVRHRPLDAEGIGKLWGVKKRMAFNKLKRLKDLAVVSCEDGRYVVDKSYIEKA